MITKKGENMNNTIYELTELEYKEIEELYDKKTAIEILFNSINEQSQLYERLLNDYNKIVKDYNQWWNRIIKKCKAEDYADRLFVDFEKKMVFVKNDLIQELG